jgi:hypothetical protein
VYSDKNDVSGLVGARGPVVIPPFVVCSLLSPSYCFSCFLFPGYCLLAPCHSLLIPSLDLRLHGAHTYVTHPSPLSRPSPSRVKQDADAARIIAHTPLIGNPPLEPHRHLPRFQPHQPIRGAQRPFIRYAPPRRSRVGAQARGDRAGRAPRCGGAAVGGVGRRGCFGGLSGCVLDTESVRSRGSGCPNNDTVRCISQVQSRAQARDSILFGK